MTAKPTTKKARIYQLWLEGKRNYEIALQLGETRQYVGAALGSALRMIAAGKTLQPKPGRPRKREDGA